MVLDLVHEMASLEKMPVVALRNLYRETCSENTKARNKRFLIKRIAWKLQANIEGDISEQSRSMAKEIALTCDLRTSQLKVSCRPTKEKLRTASAIFKPIIDPRVPVPGTILIKNYRECLVQVRVLQRSFEYDGHYYKSLTAIARVVTGQKNTNGFQFFKLGKPKAKK